MQEMKIASISSNQKEENPESGNKKTINGFGEIEQAMLEALKTYSNVHRGSGHNSMITTFLFEKARDIVLEYLGLKKDKYVVIFCTPQSAIFLRTKLEPESYKIAESPGLSMGVSAIAVLRKALPKGPPFPTGGGAARLISPDWIVWAAAPDRFEAGTPAIINIIGFAKALLLLTQYGNEIFRNQNPAELTSGEILYNDELEKYSGKELLDELRKTMIGLNTIVPTAEGPRKFINLDNSASTQTFFPVWNAFQQTWRQPKQIQQAIINEVRSICSGVLDAPSDIYDIVFTSNTTEAINLVADSLSRENGEDTDAVILNTLLEHSSNDLPWRMVSHLPLIRLSIDPEGFVNPEELHTLLSEYNRKCTHGKQKIKIVAVSGASNVLGVYNNLKEISSIVHEYGAKMLVDGAQMVAHRKIEMESWGIDYLAFSAHKVYAPFGTGVLVARKGLLNFSSMELEQIKSSGEENAGGIAALGKALLLIQKNWP
jgi:selenocysteine lyase/cysteine desulfurase